MINRRAGGDPMTVDVHPAIPQVPGALGPHFAHGDRRAGAIGNILDRRAPIHVAEHARHIGTS